MAVAVGDFVLRATGRRCDDVVLVGGERAVTALARADWRASMGGTLTATWVRSGGAGRRRRARRATMSGTLAAFDALDRQARRWSVQFPGELVVGAARRPATAAVVATWHETGASVTRVLRPRDRRAALGGADRGDTRRTGRPRRARRPRRRRRRLATPGSTRRLATGERRWQTPVPASFEAAIEPAADGDARGRRPLRRGPLLDVWRPASSVGNTTVDVALLERRMASHREVVALPRRSRATWFVLDRRNGATRRPAGPAGSLGGTPVPTGQAAVHGPVRLLIALRMRGGVNCVR